MSTLLLSQRPFLVVGMSFGPIYPDVILHLIVAVTAFGNRKITVAKCTAENEGAIVRLKQLARTFVFPMSRMYGFLLLASVVCSVVPGRVQAETAAAQSKTDRALIDVEIGDAACESSQQCKSIAVISRACGGPGEYLAYASDRVDVSKLKSLVVAYGVRLDEEQKSSGIILNCTTLADPGATCIAGRCIVGAARAVRN